MYAVSIAREYGSGGRIIGKRLAEELGAAFYDKELIALAAKEMGFSEDYVQKTEQRKTSSFLYNLYMTGQELPIPEQIFLAESEVIKRLAEKEACVIIGRCADYVLRDKPGSIRVFIYAPMDKRIKTVQEEYRENVSSPEAYIRKQDRGRASYYNFFTQQKWGQPRNYDICLNSGIGLETTVRVLKNYVEEFIGGKN